MSYNIQQIPNIGGLFDTDQANRLTQLVKALKSLDQKPDVIVFQELFYAPDYDKLTAKLKEIYPYYVSFIYSGTSG